MTTLLPRLPDLPAERLLDAFLQAAPGRLQTIDLRRLPDPVRFAATGGSPIDAGRLVALRSDLVATATANGFEGEVSTSELARFDADVSALLSVRIELSSGEALRDDFWTFVGVVLAPDIVRWRFGDARPRYLGGVRNTFQRLWLRGVALDRGQSHQDRWGLLRELTEDALVQITERPSISGERELALGVGEAWARASIFHGRGSMEPIMRRAALRIRAWNEVRALGLLPETELAQVLDVAFEVSNVERAPRAEADTPNGSPGKFVVNVGTDPPPHLAANASELRRSAARTLLKEAGSRHWLSPKSRIALQRIAHGEDKLEPSLQNALRYLVDRFASQSLLPFELGLLRKALSES